MSVYTENTDKKFENYILLHCPFKYYLSRGRHSRQTGTAWPFLISNQHAKKSGIPARQVFSSVLC
jgi:hypothetical protein